MTKREKIRALKEKIQIKQEVYRHTRLEGTEEEALSMTEQVWTLKRELRTLKEKQTDGARRYARYTIETALPDKQGWWSRDSVNPLIQEFDTYDDDERAIEFFKMETFPCIYTAAVLKKESRVIYTYEGRKFHALSWQDYHCQTWCKWVWTEELLAALHALDEL